MENRNKELKQLVGTLGDQLSSKDYEGAWQTAGALSKLQKDDDVSLSPLQSEMLTKTLKNYYYQNKKMNSGIYALGRIGESLSELASLIKS
ncbi:hypothetical protein [Streptococcus sp. S784/96/1]|uniref:hypothetical protein n=1 Tax=Streptococcus sp. S784/96/1 TaxID=2653499 RepID=UPI0013867A5A|nr:hypothetical protein [Streptococcus sp. S784/96/1]